MNDYNKDFFINKYYYFYKSYFYQIIFHKILILELIIQIRIKNILMRQIKLNTKNYFKLLVKISQ